VPDGNIAGYEYLSGEVYGGGSSFFFIVPQYVNLIWLRNCVRMWYVTKVRSINRRAKQKIKGSVIVTANISLDTKGEMTNYVGQDIFLRYLLD
jgi:hypothetical protein